jgi:hypothetical protein
MREKGYGKGSGGEVLVDRERRREAVWGARKVRSLSFFVLFRFFRRALHVEEGATIKRAFISFLGITSFGIISPFFSLLSFPCSTYALCTAEAVSPLLSVSAAHTCVEEDSMECCRALVRSISMRPCPYNERPPRTGHEHSCSALYNHSSTLSTSRMQPLTTGNETGSRSTT